MCKQVTTSFSPAGSFPAARRHCHYHQIEQELIQSCWWMPRWCPDSSTVGTTELECKKLISSWPEVLQVTPGYRGKWHKSCVSWASSSRVLCTANPHNDIRCMQNACCLTPMFKLWHPRKRVRETTKCGSHKKTSNQYPLVEEMQIILWTRASGPVPNKAVAAGENSFPRGPFSGLKGFLWLLSVEERWRFCSVLFCFCREASFIKQIFVTTYCVPSIFVITY